jgi:hypothetical protein
MIPREILKKIRQVELRLDCFLIRGIGGALGVISLLLLCSCATTRQPVAIVPATDLPDSVAMNEEAGRGNLLFVMLRLENGEELPFLVDTGTTITCFDKSLEPQLGKCRGVKKIWHDGKIVDLNFYAAPKLYLERTRLITGEDAMAFDLKDIATLSGHRIMGVLGMDCLRHYCIQLDFTAGKMRFLTSGKVAPLPGELFSLTFHWGCPRVRQAGFLAETNIDWLIDTGNAHDGDLASGLFQAEVQKRMLRATQGAPGRAWLPNCEWNNERYTNLLVGTGINSIGLRFLARHIVTFDFPQQTMYMKETSNTPLVDANMEAAATFMKTLKASGQVPGWPKDDDGIIDLEAHPDFETYDFRKDGVLSTCHYRITRAPDGISWKLQRTWRTDQNDLKIEE